MDEPFPAPDGTRWRRTQAYDERGEVHVMQALEPVPTRIRRTRYSDTFTPVFDWKKLAAARLTAPQARLFFVLMDIAPHDGSDWDASPARLMPILGWDKSRVSKEVRALTEKGLVLRSRRGHVAFNPLVSWQGAPDERERAKALLEEPE